MKMTSINICVLLLVSLSFSITQGSHHYFEHYFSKYVHHKSSSTTPSISSTSEIPTSEEKISFSQDDNKTFVTDNPIILESGGRNDDPAQYMFVSRVAVFVGSLILAIIVLGCVVCCCPTCCRGTERRGHIILERRTEAIPQPVILPSPQQPATVQHIPPEHTHEPLQQFPPQYHPPVFPPTQYGPIQHQGHQYSPMQQQPAYSPVQQPIHYSPVHPGYQDASTLQFCNPPEAPPAYELTTPK